MERKQATRVQTSILNALEKKILVKMAEKMPSRVTSDMLSAIGFLGSVLIAAGYILTDVSIHFLWLASFGFVVNWFGDSLDGTLARVRNCQRPLYGYYLDHMLDCFNELLMFVGAGMSVLMDMRIALLLLVAYLIMTVNVSINAHLRSEFKLTYAKLGPTEFRIIIIIVNSLFALIRPLREFSVAFSVCGRPVELMALDMVGLAIFFILAAMFTVTFIKDLHIYSDLDPKKR
ncbi:MAG: CDP-alcohol phosphatidyltransferase family protein [Candidatus Cryptobacteroides sp.]|nr:CDP-alcohol phosphatidyltransferase family protein [Bacteroidales bacterium]